MPDNVIKFGKAKKSLARSAKEKQAAENRVKFGRTKSQKARDKTIAEKKARHLDQHKRDE